MVQDHNDSERFRELRASVANAEKGDFNGCDVLIRALDDEDWEVRLEAAYDLRRIGFPRALAPLARMSHSDKMADNRAQALYGLEGIGRPEGIPAVIDALGDEEDLCRQAARTVLFRVIGEEVLPLVGEEGDELDPAELVRVRDWWSENSYRLEREQVYALGKLASPEVFIECLRTSATPLPDAYLSLLHDWTGQTFGEAPLPEVIAKWERWWEQNRSRFEPGRRYFYGNAVPR